jgi:hypothetical protein
MVTRLSVKVVLSTIVALFFASCTGVNEYSKEPFFQTNFDNIAGWVPEEKLLFGNAHSGNCAIMVDSLSQYSILWKRSLVRLSSQSLTKLRLSSFVKLLSASNNACMVVSIDSKEKNLFWSSVDFKNYKLSQKSWTKIEGFVEFPIIHEVDATISIYLWGRDGSSAILDDLEMEFSI